MGASVAELKSDSNWIHFPLRIGLLEYVLQKGAPEVVPSGARFALDVYGLESTLEMEGEAKR